MSPPPGRAPQPLSFALARPTSKQRCFVPSHPDRQTLSFFSHSCLRLPLQLHLLLRLGPGRCLVDRRALDDAHLRRRRRVPRAHLGDAQGEDLFGRGCGGRIRRKTGGSSIQEFVYSSDPVIHTWRKGKRPLASMPTRYCTLGRVEVMAWMYACGVDCRRDRSG